MTRFRLQFGFGHVTVKAFQEDHDHDDGERSVEQRHSPPTTHQRRGSRE
jgi:hypothetical protein